MKKLYILLVLFVVCVSCDSFGNKDVIEKAKAEAIAEVNKAKDKAVEEAKVKIASVATSQLMEANDSIKKAIEDAQTTIIAGIKKETKTELEGIDDKFKASVVLGVTTSA